MSLPVINLTRDPLQMLKVDALAYGAKDTGEMGGGAAAAILAAAGPEIVPELRSKLASTSRRVGDVVATSSHKLQTTGVRWILHIISIIKNTPEGAYCPHPELLRNGVHSALKMASSLGARSIAISALGTGEGRVNPQAAAKYMLGGAKTFFQNKPNARMTVTFSLPSYRDYEAFRTENHS